MNTHSLPKHMVQAPSLPGPHEGYMPGFGNDFETEALPGALPQLRQGPRQRLGLKVIAKARHVAFMRSRQAGRLNHVLGQGVGVHRTLRGSLSHPDNSCFCN